MPPAPAQDPQPEYTQHRRVETHGDSDIAIQIGEGRPSRSHTGVMQNHVRPRLRPPHVYRLALAFPKRPSVLCNGASVKELLSVVLFIDLCRGNIDSVVVLPI